MASKHNFRRDHDLSLGAVGPYSRRFLGIAQILDPKSGQLMAWPLGVEHVGGKKIPAEPGKVNERDWTLLEADAGLSFFTYRYMLLGVKDLFCDGQYMPLDGNRFLCVIKAVNNTDREQSVSVTHGIVHEWEPPRVRLALPEKAVLVQADAYESLSSYHRYGVDGELECVRQVLFASNGKALEGRFGEWPGDQVAYQLKTDGDMADARLYIRYHKVYDNTQKFKLRFDDREHEIGFARTAERTGSFGGWSYLEVPLGDVKQGAHTVTLEVLEPQNLFLEKGYTRNLYTFPVDEDLQKRTEFAMDFLCLADGPQNTAFWVARVPEPADPLVENVMPNRTVLRDKRVRDNHWFALGTAERGAAFSRFHEEYYVQEVNEHHVKRPCPADEATPADDRVVAYGLNMQLPIINLGPGSERVIKIAGVRAEGPTEAAEELTKALKQADAVYAEKRAAYEKGRFPTYDKKIGPSVAHLMAISMSNVFYPIQVMDRQIIGTGADRFHFALLYTWDAGMTALGQAEYNADRAIENIMQYLVESDPKRGFIQHGTGLPTQIYALWDLFQRTQDIELAGELYKAACNAYRFYAGTHPASTTMRNQNNLVNTSVIWYNAVGMDDYPVQQYCAVNNLLSHAGLPESNASAVRFAKIMRLCAHVLRHRKDIKEFSEDIDRFDGALQALWDEKSGYYYWLNNGEPILHESGVNYNMGVSGVYPLVSGVDDPERRKRLIDHLKNPAEMWTDIGISTVDKTAPYYDPKGYWNGRVWMAHQWMLWKAMLDCGEAAFAEQIARTALDLYAREEKRTGLCFENFDITTREGGGEVHFSSLSVPVINFYCAYFSPGRISTGFDVYAASKKMDKKGLPVEITFASPFTEPHETAAVLVLEPDKTYDIDGREHKASASGSVNVVFSIDQEKTLTINKG